MTAWVVICVVVLVLAAPQVLRARRIERQPLFDTWVAPRDPSTPPGRPSTGPSPDPGAAGTQDQPAGPQDWTALDDRQLTRLLAQASDA